MVRMLARVLQHSSIKTAFAFRSQQAEQSKTPTEISSQQAVRSTASHIRIPSEGRSHTASPKAATPKRFLTKTLRAQLRRFPSLISPSPCPFLLCWINGERAPAPLTAE